MVYFLHIRPPCTLLALWNVSDLYVNCKFEIKCNLFNDENFICKYLYIQDVPRGISHTLVNLHWSELHSYGGNDVRKVVSLWFYILHLFNVMHYWYIAQACLWAVSRPRHAEVTVLCKVLGILRMIFMRLVWIFLT